MFSNPYLIRHALVAIVIAGLAPVAAAQPNDPVIVDTAFVKEAKSRGALIWDVRSQNVYLRGHIPGAVNIDSISDVLRDPRTEDYIAISEIERILGEAGIDASREMVLYGSKAHPDAYFGYITMRYLGAAKVAVYHGGIDDWKDGGNTVDTDLVKLPPTTFTANPDDSLLATTREVIRKIGDPSVQIVDARSVSEFTGEDIRALRGGHVPGAVNIPYEENWIDPDTPRKLARKQVDNKDGMNLKPRESLQAMYAQLDPNKETIVYCQSGSRASVLAVVLQELGFGKVRVYDSSWLGYGNTFDAPAEDVTYFNVGRVNRMIRSLQNQIDLLEGEIEALKARKE
jgi:thiosulfate/3-mercaptopyruvate sulfurtransferase